MARRPEKANNSPAHRTHRLARTKRGLRCAHPTAILAFCTGAVPLPEGDLKIARQFTAGFTCHLLHVPKGRLNPSNEVRLLIILFLIAAIQPSLWDATSLFDNPTLERVGYSRFSLRETADWSLPLE